MRSLLEPVSAIRCTSAHIRARRIIWLVMDTRPGSHGHSEKLREPQSEPVVGGLAPGDELETRRDSESMVAEFASLTTPYCWVITEDAAAGDDGAEPSVVGKSGPGQAVAGDVTEA